MQLTKELKLDENMFTIHPLFIPSWYASAWANNGPSFMEYFKTTPLILCTIFLEWSIIKFMLIWDNNLTLGQYMCIRSKVLQNIIP